LDYDRNMHKDNPLQGNTQLTEREEEILLLLATGKNNKEIAGQLFISSNTVKVHLRNIFTKIGVASRTEAAVYAIHKGLSQTADQVAVAPLTKELPTVTLEPSEPKNRKWILWSAPLVIVLLVGFLIILATKFQSPAIALVSTASAKAPQRWQKLADLPTARSGLAIAVFENQIYAIGGESDQGVTGVVEQYDAASDSWFTLPSKPVPVADINAAVIGGKIYIPGGRLASGSMTNAFESFDPRRGIWERCTPLPVAVSGYALVTFEGRLYLFGGWDGQHYLNTVYIYRPESESWSAGKSMPTARGFAGAAVAGGKIYVVGGKNQDGIVSANEVYGLNLNGSDVSDWQIDESLPVSASGIGVISVADVVYAVVSDHSKNGIYVFHNNSGAKHNNWEFLPMPYGFGSRFSIVMESSKLYIMGGYLDSKPISLNVSYDAIYTIVLPIVK
jgi:DNA-binding CsgD family transcriptional regulator